MNERLEKIAALISELPRGPYPRVSLGADLGDATFAAIREQCGNAETRSTLYVFEPTDPHAREPYVIESFDVVVLGVTFAAQRCRPATPEELAAHESRAGAPNGSVFRTSTVAAILCLALLSGCVTSGEDSAPLTLIDWTCDDGTAVSCPANEWACLDGTCIPAGEAADCDASGTTACSETHPYLHGDYGGEAADTCEAVEWTCDDGSEVCCPRGTWACLDGTCAAPPRGQAPGPNWCVVAGTTWCSLEVP